MLRICAPRASVLPPAPAQKSTTISPRLAPVSNASSWLPSSCTSAHPSVSTPWRCKAGLPATRRPTGEYGVGSASMPSPRRRASTSSRLALSDVGAQVERRRLVDAVRPLPELVAERGLQPLDEPVGQVVTQPARQAAAVDGQTALEPRQLGFAQRCAQEAGVALPAEDRQAPLRFAAARLRQMPIERELAQHGIGRLGQRVPLARAERARFAKELGDDAIGGVLETQQSVHQLGRGLEQGVRMHRGDYPWRSRAPPPRATRRSQTPPSLAFQARREPRDAASAARARASSLDSVRARRRPRRHRLAGCADDAVARPDRLECARLAVPRLGGGRSGPRRHGTHQTPGAGPGRKRRHRAGDRRSGGDHQPRRRRLRADRGQGSRTAPHCRPPALRAGHGARLVVVAADAVRADLCRDLLPTRAR